MHTRLFSTNFFQKAILATRAGDAAKAFQYFGYSLYDPSVNNIDKAKAATQLGQHYLDKIHESELANQVVIDRDINMARQYLLDAVKFCEESHDLRNTAQNMLQSLNKVDDNNSKPVIHPL